MKIVAKVLGCLFLLLAIVLNVRPVSSEAGERYAFWDRNLPLSVGAAVLAGVLLLPRKWVWLSLAFIAAALVVRVMTYLVLRY